MGRSEDELSTIIHDTVDVFGNPTSLHLTLGLAHDLEDAIALAPGLKADKLITDMTLDAGKCLIMQL